MGRGRQRAPWWRVETARRAGRHVNRQGSRCDRSPAPDPCPFSTDTITVYQAYASQVAVPALAAGRFVSPFKRDRMTWIKPSFLWMMYRSGWAEKPGQEHVLAIGITRTGFEWALERACLSHFDAARHGDHAAWSRQLKASPVRLQWDPERSLRLQPLPYRSVQVGLSGEAVDRYVLEWIGRHHRRDPDRAQDLGPAGHRRRARRTRATARGAPVSTASQARRRHRRPHHLT